MSVYVSLVCCFWRFSNYFTDKVLDLLGEGGYGTVVRACKVVRDCEVPESKDVAIKISAVRKGRSNAARKEFRILETIKMNDEKNQKGCIRVQECFEYRGHICMVMELLAQSTCEFLEQNNYLPYPKSQIQSFARQLFDSVACKCKSVCLIPKHTDEV